MDLRERLRYAVGGGASEVAPEVRRTPLDDEGGWLPDLDLQCVETALGDVYFSEQCWPLAHRHGHRSLGEALDIDSATVARLAPGLSQGDLGRALFVDVETTGLSGGTGTYVFLVGLGCFDDDAFRVRQLFLAGPSGEEAMLAFAASALADARGLVTFNGRGFDMPLLETRFTLNRLPAPSPLPHLDLLYPARRLYRRRLESCRLAHLENVLLGLEREDDVPGWLIPSLYFDYLRFGRVGPLAAVFRHNALDVLSMVTLLAHLGDVVGGKGPRRAADCLALARWEEVEGHRAEAASLYETALADCDDEQQRMQAVRPLLRLYRRERRWPDMAALLESIAAGHATAEHRLEALVGLAKLREHQERRFSEAEALARRALTVLELVELRRPPVGPFSREDLEHRLTRLRRRAAIADRSPSR